MPITLPFSLKLINCINLTLMQQDTIWKAIVEDLAEDMLRFFFPTYVDLIDFSRGIEFMDKELYQLMLDSDTQGRRADKLMKVWLHNHTEAWFLVHIEVQGYRDNSFGLRMFQSAYRILDKFGKPLVALVIYTDTDRAGHVSEYRTSFMGTELIYKFNTYIVMDHPPEELAASKGPMGIQELILEELKKEAIEEGRKKGLKEGIELAKKKVIAKGIKQGLPIEVFSFSY